MRTWVCQSDPEPDASEPAGPVESAEMTLGVQGQKQWTADRRVPTMLGQGLNWVA